MQGIESNEKQRKQKSSIPQHTAVSRQAFPEVTRKEQSHFGSGPWEPALQPGTMGMSIAILSHKSAAATFILVYLE